MYKCICGWVEKMLGRKVHENGPQACQLCLVPHQGSEPAPLFWQISLIEVSQVGHAATLDPIQGIIVLVNASAGFLMALLQTGQFAPCLHENR